LFDRAGNRRALDLVMADMQKKVAGFKNDKQKLAFFDSLGLDAQASSAFSILSSDAAKLHEFMAATAHSAGELGQAYEASLSPADKLAMFGNRFDGLMLKLGYEMIPAVERALVGVNTAFDWLVAHA
jgi:hypothetical protein